MTPLAVLSTPRAPVEVRLVSERRVNDTLELMLDVIPSVVWPADGVLIDVAGIRDGEEIRHLTVSPTKDGLSDPSTRMVDGLLRPGMSVKVPVVLTAPGITDYRIDVKWGSHSSVDSGADSSAPGGEGSTPGSTVTAPARGVEGHVDLANVTMVVQEQRCAAARCPIEYLYSAVLQNRSNKTISSVVLAAYFRDANGSEGEPSELTVNGLQMPPGGERPLRVTFESPLGAGGEPRAVTPRLTVRSFE